jgi:hypothetical protein
MEIPPKRKPAVSIVVWGMGWEAGPCTFVGMITGVVSFAVRESVAVVAHALPLAGCAGTS